MPVELAGNPGDEGGRNEHCAQHQGDGDQRRTDLVHAPLRGITRRQTGSDIALHVLDHDDRIVDHDADGENQAEQRQIVEREPEHRHEEEGADQRHGIATIGMMAARQVCRNRMTTRTTRTIASAMVSVTASIDCWMNSVGL